MKDDLTSTGNIHSPAGKGTLKKNIATIDLDTGELIEGTAVWFNKRNKHPWENDFLMNRQSFLEEFAARRDIGLQVYRVFLFLNARCDFENIIYVKQTDIAKALGMRPSHISSAIRQLKELGVILQGPIPSTYRLNPNCGWKGKVRHLNTALSTEEE
jgi:hypothetical protein